ncbi:MAG: amidohydrolase family protein, partial [Bacillota bacterium]|nr:amidohydrolase family protein [Bacillota bacterium]
MNSLRLTNGKIFTGNPTAPWAKEMLILNGRIAWIGQGGSPSLPGVETLDLGGRLALPGLVDAHVHFLWYALGLDSVRMVGVESLDQALDLVAERVSNTSLGEWIVGDSYNHNVWRMDSEPNRYDLDRVAPD